MKRIIVGTAAVAAVTLVADSAHASGFLAARFGGEHGHPTTSNPTAIYYNPAGLALERHGPKTDGWNFRLYLDGTFAYRTASYERPVGAIDHVGTGTPEEAIAANSGKGTLADFIASPFVAVTTDFGLPNFGAGIGVFVPFGGVASWDKNEDFRLHDRYPGAVDGVQRWWTMDGRIQSLYVSAAAAYRFESLRLSLGASLSAVQSTVHTVRARNADGTDDMVAGDTLKEGRSYVDASGWNLGLGLGVIWEPVERLWIGASWQSRPGLGEMSLEGQLHNALAVSPTSVTEIEFLQEMPDVWRFGARWRPENHYELRLFGEYVTWSNFEKQCLLVRDNPDRNCDLLENGGTGPNGVAITQNIMRRWEDAFGIRGGFSWWFTPDVEGYLGFGYDSNAVPDETLEPALIDMDKYTAAVGAQFRLSDRWLLSATFTQVIYSERELSLENARVFEAPSRQPKSAGTYNQAISVLNLNTQYSF